jgi:hypothetical protein
MIANPSIAFNEFSGSAKGVTARYTKGRTVLSVRCYPTGVASPSQLVSRKNLNHISRTYKLLTDEQQLAWARLAERLRSRAVLGSRIKLTPHNAFVRLNCNRALAGQGILMDPPELKSIPQVNFGAFYVNSDEVVVESVRQPDDNYKLVVKMTGAQSTGVSNAWSKTVVISSSEDADWGDLDLTEAFAEVKGTAPSDGFKYFVEMYWLDSETGFTGQVRQFSGVAGSESLDGDGAEGSRRQIKIKFCDKSSSWDKTYMKNIDFELSPGSLLGSIKGEFASTGSMSSWAAQADPAVNELVPPFICYALGRETDLYNPGTHGRLGVLEIFSQFIHWYPDPDRYEFFIGRTNVQAVKSFELFDTTVVKLK